MVGIASVDFDLFGGRNAGKAWQCHGNHRIHLIKVVVC